MCLGIPGKVIDIWEDSGTRVDSAHSEAVLAAMRVRPEGAASVIIGRAVHEHPGMVVAGTPFGTTRVVERELGEQLPRIC